MADQYISIRNLKFLLFEHFNLTDINRLENFKDYDQESFEMALAAAKEIGDQHLFPHYQIMDKEKAYFKDGEVITHEKLIEGINAIAEGGWIGAAFPYDDGGQQMPLGLLTACQFIFHSANANISCYPFLTQGAANLIRTFGSDDLKNSYLEKMMSGEWQGTMALTEPQAGSSLSDLTSSATPTDQGHYLIEGQKIYISGGDYKDVDNVVHLLLARIKGAPAGTKGISLFVVPKHRNVNGEYISNDVTTAGIYGKMGQKGYVAAHLMLGEKEDCHGYLVGEPNNGLRYMFQMMNEARIATGLVAAGNTSAAYYAALQYANERPQGRKPGQKGTTDPVLIIEHADVRRMLLYQKAVMEGSIALLLYCSNLGDLEMYGEGAEKARAHQLFELLTPIAKSYPSEAGTHAVSYAMQCLGGAGYTDDFPVEQYYRDIRINSIYEGTTTIHGLDLLGRKVMMHGGTAFKFLIEEIQVTAKKAADHPALASNTSDLIAVAKSLHEVTIHLGKLASTESPEVFLSDATLYLDYFSLLVISWQLLGQAITASAALKNDSSETDQAFYESKLITADYFFEYELPKSRALHKRLISENRITLNLKNHHLQ